MIKIIAGTFGYRNPDTGLIEAKTPESKPFSIPNTPGMRTEADLVALGVAEYVDDKPNVKDEEVKVSNKPNGKNNKAKKAQDEVSFDDKEEPLLSAAEPE